MSFLRTVFAIAAMLLPLSAFPDSFDGRLSEAAKIQYNTAMSYEQLIKQDVTTQSFNPKIRFQLEIVSISSKPLVNPYLQLLNKTTNKSVIFKELFPGLPLFVGESKGVLLKRVESLPPGGKAFAYATLSYSWVPQQTKKTKNLLVTYLLLDDLLTQEEELAMDEYRVKFGKPKPQGKTATAPEKKTDPAVKAN